MFMIACLASVLTATPPLDPALLTAVRAAQVEIRLTLRFDNWEAPTAGGWSERCPNCGGYHAGLADGLAESQRPLRMVGYLLEPGVVVTPDPLIDPRFVERITVAHGDREVSASIRSVAIPNNMLFLALAEPLPQTPLTFDAQAHPAFSVTHQSAGTGWRTTIQPLSPALTLGADGKASRPAPDHGLILAATGQPIGFARHGRLPHDTAWAGSPLEWPQLTHAALAERLAGLQAATRTTIPLVTLHFRNPPATPDDPYRYMDEEEAPTVLHVLAVAIDDRELLILKNLEPRVTARLERITVHLADGTARPAVFKAALRHYGAFVATLADPLPMQPAWTARPIADAVEQVLLSGLIRVIGEERLAHFSHQRVIDIERGWRGLQRPELAMDTENVFLFDDAGALWAVPVERRAPATFNHWSYAESQLVPVDELRAALAGGAGLALHNVPLPEAEQERRGWLGAKLQPLDAQLARARGVAYITQDGNSGGLVTSVYANSPAARAGIEPGMILLRLRTLDDPSPIEIELNGYGHDMYNEGFPWAQLDAIPASMFEDLPRPWPGVNTALSDVLTSLGVGTPYIVDVAHDGRILHLDAVVEVSPPHHDTAAKFESTELGLTVRDLTYEVLEYYRRTAEDPGVVVTHIEPGGRAAVAGLKPYEIITTINDGSVHDVDGFEAAVAADALRLTVLRMAQERVIKLQRTAAE